MAGFARFSRVNDLFVDLALEQPFVPWYLPPRTSPVDTIHRSVGTLVFVRP